MKTNTHLTLRNAGRLSRRLDPLENILRWIVRPRVVSPDGQNHLLARSARRIVCEGTSFGTAENDESQTTNFPDCIHFGDGSRRDCSNGRWRLCLYTGEAADGSTKRIVELLKWLSPRSTWPPSDIFYSVHLIDVKRRVNIFPVDKYCPILKEPKIAGTWL